MKKFLSFVFFITLFLTSCTDVAKTKHNQFVFITLPGGIAKAAYTPDDVDHYTAKLFLGETLASSHQGKSGGIIACEALVPGVYTVNLTAYKSTEENDDTLIAEGSSPAIVTAGEVTSVEVILTPKENPGSIPVTSVTIARAGEGPVYEGSSITLVATVLPENATDKTLTWTSSDENFATVENGVVTAKNVGHTIISAKSVNDITATYELVIEALPASKAVVTYSTDLGIMPDSITVDAGTTLTEENLPTLEEKGYKFIGWYIGETKVEPGYKVEESVTLTAKWSEIEVTSVSLTAEKTSLFVGGTSSLTATVLPEDAKNKTLTWKSSDETVATIEDGILTAKKEGSVTITATASNGISGSMIFDVTPLCPIGIQVGSVQNFAIFATYYPESANPSDYFIPSDNLEINFENLDLNFFTTIAEDELELLEIQWNLNGNQISNEKTLKFNPAKSQYISAINKNIVECSVKKGDVVKNSLFVFKLSSSQMIMGYVDNCDYFLAASLNELDKADGIPVDVPVFKDSSTVFSYNADYNVIEMYKLEANEISFVDSQNYTVPEDYYVYKLIFDPVTNYLYAFASQYVSSGDRYCIGVVDTNKQQNEVIFTDLTDEIASRIIKETSASFCKNQVIYGSCTAIDSNEDSLIYRIKTSVTKDSDGNIQSFEITETDTIIENAMDFIGIAEDDPSRTSMALKFCISDFYQDEAYIYAIVRFKPEDIEPDYDTHKGVVYSKGALIRMTIDETSGNLIFDESFGKFGWSDSVFDGSYTNESYYSEISEYTMTEYRPEIPKADEFTGFFGPKRIIAIKNKKLIIQDNGLWLVYDDPEKRTSSLKNPKLHCRKGFVTVDLNSKSATFTKSNGETHDLGFSSAWIWED